MTVTTTIYKVTKDLNYQFYLPIEWDSKITMDCTPKTEIWQSIRFYNPYPLLKRGSFFHFDSNAFIIDEITRRELDGFWYTSELLPIEIEDEQDIKYHIVNILECVNCLDKEKTIWDGEAIKRYAFHLKRLTGSGLFKIPNDNGAFVYVLTRSNDQISLNFKELCEANNLRGLIFRKVWEHKEI